MDNEDIFYAGMVCISGACIVYWWLTMGGCL